MAAHMGAGFARGNWQSLGVRYDGNAAPRTEGANMLFRSIALSLLVVLASCATTSAPPTPQPNINVMRHLHTPKGATDPDLTAEGFRHAAAVSEWFRRDPPNAIYVSSTKRAQQTAAVLAQRLKLAPKIYDPRDTTGLIVLC